VAAAISAWFGRPVEAATQSGRRDAHLAELEREVGEVSAAGLPLNTEESTLRVVLEDEGVTE
jgi:hypothetical protein